MNASLRQILRGAAAAALASFVLAAPARSQGLTRDAVKSELGGTDALQDVSIGAKPNDKTSVYVLPVPIVDPTVGNGLALAGLVTFRLDPTDKSSPRATFGAAAGYTDSQSAVVGGNLKLFLDRDRYRVGFLGGYGALNVKFYGIGEGGVFQNRPLNFNLSGTFFSGSITTRIAPHFYLGPSYRFLTSTSGFNFPGLPAGVTLPQLQANLSGLGLTSEYDSRDSQFSPRSGVYATAQLIDYADTLGSDFSFLSFDGTGSQYLRLSHDFVLASNIRYAAVGSGAPFFALPFVSLRGFPGGKYLGRDVWQAQAELRWSVFDRIGLVGFAGVGQAAQSLGDFGKNTLLCAGGVGIRYAVSETERVNLGLDYAVGTDGGSTFYFRIGEAF